MRGVPDAEQARAIPALEPIDRSPRIAVFTNAVDQSVWSLRSLGFTADPIGTTALNGAGDPLANYDVIFSTANYPANTAGNANARAKLAAFFAAGGGYIGGGANGASFLTNGALVTGLTSATRSPGGAGWSVSEEMLLSVGKIGPSKGVSAPISS